MTVTGYALIMAKTCCGSPVYGQSQSIMERNMKEYKVLTQKLFKPPFQNTKFDPEKLEAKINSYAAEGWAVVSVATGIHPTFWRQREELVVVMEKDKKPGQL